MHKVYNFLFELFAESIFFKHTISNDLVNDAIAASKAAQKVVTKVVNAFTDALNALSSSKQANNTTELTNIYISLAIASLLNEKIAEQLKEFKKSRSITFDSSIYTLRDARKIICKAFWC